MDQERQSESGSQWLYRSGYSDGYQKGLRDIRGFLMAMVTIAALMCLLVVVLWKPAP